ncbi:MAG: hypothetical protein HY690_14000 [Chloroflexi bacterium]|nr:hypothetical protein [Chloroflexota bacterium]
MDGTAHLALTLGVTLAIGLVACRPPLDPDAELAARTCLAYFSSSQPVGPVGADVRRAFESVRVVASSAREAGPAERLLAVERVAAAQVEGRARLVAARSGATAPAWEPFQATCEGTRARGRWSWRVVASYDPSPQVLPQP